MSFIDAQHESGRCLPRQMIDLLASLLLTIIWKIRIFLTYWGGG